MPGELGFYLFHNKSYCLPCWVDVFGGLPAERTSWHLRITAEIAFKRPIRCFACERDIPVQLEENEHGD